MVGLDLLFLLLGVVLIFQGRASVVGVSGSLEESSLSGVSPRSETNPA
jgi:hypothetical protein